MIPAFLAQAIQYGGRPLAKGLAAFLLAIQDPQGVLFKPALAGLAKTVVPLPQIGPQGVVVFGPAIGAADGVDMHPQALDPHPGQHGHGQADAFRVRAGPGRPVNLHPKLVMLPKPPRLGLVIPEHRAIEVIHLGGLGVVEQPVLQKHPGRPRRALGLEGDGTAALIVKGIHFLLYDIRGIPHPPQKQLRMLDDRGADLPEPVRFTDRPGLGLDILPLVAFFRGNVFGALGGLYGHSLSLLLRYGRPCRPG